MNRSHQITRARMSALAAAALAGALVLSGCNGTTDPQPSPTTAAPTTVETPTGEPTTTETATETEEPTSDSTLPELPDEAKENTPEGAEAFIRYYFDVANDLYIDPPPSDQIDAVVDPLIDPECISCENLKSELNEFSQGSWRLTDDLYQIDSIEAIGGGEPSVQRFNMVMTNLAHVIVGEDGTEHKADAQTLEGVGAAIWSGEQWRIYDMGLE